MQGLGLSRGFVVVAGAGRAGGSPALATFCATSNLIAPKTPRRRALPPEGRGANETSSRREWAVPALRAIPRLPTPLTNAAFQSRS